MSIIGFVPGPEAAATVVAWTRALTGSSDETEFLCLEIGFGGRTEQAVREALGEAGADPPTLTAIRDPMPVTAVLEHARKANAGLLVTGSFALPEVDGKPQTSVELMRSAPCQTFLALYGEKGPSEIKKILFVATGQAHDRTALRLVDAFRQSQSAHVTVASIEDETGQGGPSRRTGDPVAAARRGARGGRVRDQGGGRPPQAPGHPAMLRGPRLRVLRLLRTPIRTPGHFRLANE